MGSGGMQGVPYSGLGALIVPYGEGLVLPGGAGAVVKVLR